MNTVYKPNKHMTKKIAKKAAKKAPKVKLIEQTLKEDLKDTIPFKVVKESEPAQPDTDMGAKCCEGIKEISEYKKGYESGLREATYRVPLLGLTEQLKSDKTERKHLKGCLKQYQENVEMLTLDLARLDARIKINETKVLEIAYE